MRIAVIGAGVAGLSAAWLLSRRHDITVYERESRLGGHSNTIDARFGASRVPVDTGFIVFNRNNYPNLVALLAHLGVACQASSMSFAASLDDGAFEYGSGNFSFFAQPANLADRRYHAFLGDIFRFNRLAPRWNGAAATTLGEFLAANNFGAYFTDRFLLPLAASIWSSSTGDIGHFPFARLVDFFKSHRLFNVWRQQKWRTVRGGARAYVEKLAAPLDQRARLALSATCIRRETSGISIRDSQGQWDRFDHAILATHADQALGLLERPSVAERAALGAFRYSAQDTYLHSDRSLMPKRRAVWSSWNFVAPRHEPTTPVSVTYWLNRLQNIPRRFPLFVSNNPYKLPAQELIHASMRYEHPVYDRAAFDAQQQLSHIQGTDRIWFCGSYFGFGFHEDALAAGLDVAEQFGVRRPWGSPAPRRAKNAAHPVGAIVGPIGLPAPVAAMVPKSGAAIGRMVLRQEE